MSDHQIKDQAARDAAARDIVEDDAAVCADRGEQGEAGVGVRVREAARRRLAAAVGAVAIGIGLQRVGSVIQLVVSVKTVAIIVSQLKLFLCHADHTCIIKSQVSHITVQFSTLRTAGRSLKQ